MRISIEKKFIALANPRCGSTSVRVGLDKYCEYRSRVNCRLDHHDALRTVQGFIEEIGLDLSNFFIFTTVRNPWDRAVSIYHYGLKNEKSAWHAPAITAGTFSNFLNCDMLLRHFRPELSSKPLPQGPYDVASFCADKSGALVGQAFKIEELDKLKSELFQNCGLRIDLPHVNVTERNNYQSYYNDKDVERVAFLFEMDIKMFEYTFDLD